MKSLLVIFLGAILVLFFGLGKKESKTLPLVIAILLVALALIPMDMMGLLPWAFEMKYVPMDMVFFEKQSLALSGILILSALFVVALFGRKETAGADLLGLLLFSLCGAILMTAFTNLIMLFIGLEALSIPLYVLAGSRKSDIRGNEAAIKYFLMGAFSTAVFLLGCAFIYGASGGVDLPSIMGLVDKMGHYNTIPSLFGVGMSLVLIGLCFKVSAFPFHFWSPDVYEGSPVRTTVFMATIVKIAALAALYRLFSQMLGQVRLVGWGNMLAVISALTILVGNIGALRQRSVKRTLAYSGIAQAGYMLMAIISYPALGYKGLFVYALAYCSANAIIFYYFSKLSENGNEEFSAFSGLAKNNKTAGFLVALSMLSLAGIPLTAGFAGKYNLFSAAFSDYLWLVLVALLGSAISIAYYFRIFKEVFFSEGTADLKASVLEKSILVLAGLVIAVFGIAPNLLSKIGIF
jgi:NADH-quinone oxidoreductase subunit N